MKDTTRHARLAARLTQDSGENWTPQDVAAFERLAGKPVEVVEAITRQTRTLP